MDVSESDSIKANKENVAVESANKEYGQFLDQDGQVDMNNFLVNAASFFVKKARESLGESARLSELIPGEIAMASLCSGSGAGELAFQSAVTGLSEEFMNPLKGKLIFCCEKETWKQEWLLKNILVGDAGNACLYDDVLTLGLGPPSSSEMTSSAKIIKHKTKGKGDTSDHPHCVVHDKECSDCRDTPIFILKSGFSCKGNSRMNVKFSDFRTAMKSIDFASCSVATCYGSLAVIEHCKPKVVILENVDSIGNESQPDSNLHKVVAELEAIDDAMYAVKVFHLCASDYLLPQKRRDLVCCCALSVSFNANLMQLSSTY